MRMRNLASASLREIPAEAQLASHRLLLRAGFAVQEAQGVFSLLPLGLRAVAKIEAACRSVMDAAQGQEVRLPCLGSKERWEEAGRYGSIDSSMFRLADRNEKPLVLCMTHEEPMVALVRSQLSSYRQLPWFLYQIQTKFRDEPRPRGGLIRLREFTMKDGYSFARTEEEFEKTYTGLLESYAKFFKQLGCRNVLCVESDNGMFGGSYSHEFMLLTPAGEDTLLLCSACTYRANREAASCHRQRPEEVPGTLTEVPTPGVATIPQLTAFFQREPADFLKTVVYEAPSGAVLVVCLRGDLEVEETKLKNFAKDLSPFWLPASPATLVAIGAAAGAIGPRGLRARPSMRVIVDLSVAHSRGLIAGANAAHTHFTGWDTQRDFLQDAPAGLAVTGDIASVRAGDGCPRCQAPLHEERGIEVGNVFHLGRKYTQAMECTFLGADGKREHPVMGCYGIGITRLLPAIIEQSRDDKGMILPLPVSPYQVHLCAINLKDSGVLESAEALYVELQAHGVEVLFDDRDEKAGVQFADADLFGFPLRVLVSPKTLGAGAQAELKFRDGRGPPWLEPLEGLGKKMATLLAQEALRYEA